RAQPVQPRVRCDRDQPAQREGVHLRRRPLSAHGEPPRLPICARARAPPALRDPGRRAVDVAAVSGQRGRSDRPRDRHRGLLPRAVGNPRAAVAILRGRPRLVHRHRPARGEAMTRALLSMLATETRKLTQAGLYKPEKIYARDRPAATIDFISQDYLGLARDPRVLAAARSALDDEGLGVGSPRGFTGTRPIHKDLEQALARFLGVADAVVVGSGYLANLGLYEAVFDRRDCLFCDALVHPSTAEGVRLSGATAFPFRNNDIDDLEDKLKRSRSARFRAVVTDGVFP